MALPAIERLARLGEVSPQVAKAVSIYRSNLQKEGIPPDELSRLVWGYQSSIVNAILVYGEDKPPEPWEK